MTTRHRLSVTAIATAAALVSLAAARHPDPQPFAPGIVATGHEFTVTFTPDGREVYFTRSIAQPRSAHVMHSVQRDGVWQPAEPASFSGDAWYDLDPGLSPDGSRLYFISTRPRPNAKSAPTTPDMDIWYADRTPTGWGAPRWIEELSSDAKEGSPTVDRAGNICFFSDRGNAPNKNAIYCARRRGDHWDAPVKQNANVNAGPSDTSPFLSPDGNTLLFYSERADGRGKADLYITRKSGVDWGAAMNLGPIVNTGEFEYNPSVSPDGKTFYFGRSGMVMTVPLTELDSRIISGDMFR